MKKLSALIIGTTLAFTATFASADVLLDSGDTLYSITPTDAYADTMSGEQIVYILDVRTDSEFIWVGHPNVDNVINVSYKIDYKGAFIVNPSFLSDMDDVFGENKDARIISMCRSGARSIDAAKALIAAGFTNVTYMSDGFEGGKDADGLGYRTTYGWKNSGLPGVTSKVGDDSYYAD